MWKIIRSLIKSQGKSYKHIKKEKEIIFCFLDNWETLVNKSHAILKQI